MKYPKRSFINLAAISLIGWLFVSCSSIKPEKPLEYYSNIEIIPAKSTINLPLDIEVQDLEQLVNKNLVGLLYEDNDLDDDNLMIKAWKTGQIVIRLEGSELEWQIPLKLWIKLGVKLEKFGLTISDTYELNAEIQLKYKTILGIAPDWSLKTNTFAKDYKWIKPPTLKLAGINIPVTYIADEVLKSNQERISKEIDKAVANGFDLKKMATETWEAIQKPIKISDEYNAWLKINPLEIKSMPIKGVGGKIVYKAGIVSTTKCFVNQEPPSEPITKLPNLKLTQNIDDGFEVNLLTTIPYTYIEETAKKQLLNQTFKDGKRSLTIDEIKIYGSYDRLIVEATVHGSIKGTLFFAGKPVYNPENKAIEIENLDFELKTKNLLHSSAAWLFESKVRRELTKYLSYPIGDQLTQTQGILQEYISTYPVGSGVVLKGNLSKIEPGQIILTPGALLANMLFKGSLKVTTELGGD